MIKFIHKKSVKGEESEKGKIIIYYNVTDIFLGLILLSLVVFFANYYLSHSIGKKQDNNCFIYTMPVLNTHKSDIKK